MTFVKA
ncbi:hypothetical protein VTH06DRAFT_2765 [Thermothelomyces fergusii]